MKCISIILVMLFAICGCTQKKADADNNPCVKFAKYACMRGEQTADCDEGRGILRRSVGDSEVLANNAKSNCANTLSKLRESIVLMREMAAGCDANPKAKDCENRTENETHFKNVERVLGE